MSFRYFYLPLCCTVGKISKIESDVWIACFNIPDFGTGSTIAARKPSKRSDLLLENERVAREMILEFPSVSDGYESLFSIARDSDPERSKVILVDLEKMTTPPWLKDRARMHLTRLALLRRSLPSVLSSADEVALISPTRGLPVAIYSWSVGSPVNQAKIRALAAKNKHVFFLGVCLDPDSPAVRQAAAAARMPGALRFSSSGVSGRFASILTFSRPGDLFLVDATGVITDIHGDIESSVKLAQLKR